MAILISQLDPELLQVTCKKPASQKLKPEPTGFHATGYLLAGNQNLQVFLLVTRFSRTHEHP